MRNFPFSLTLVFPGVMSREMKTNCLVTGIIDWADAKIAPFGVSLANMEVVLGIQTRTNWHFHPNHHSLRELFWKTFYRVTGYISKDDRRSIEVARLFGFFREHGREEKEHAIAYLSALCLL
jgi:hypothetical protein